MARITKRDYAEMIVKTAAYNGQPAAWLVKNLSLAELRDLYYEAEEAEAEYYDYF